MAIRESTSMPLVLGWATGQDGWGGDMNRNLGLLSTLAQLTIESLAFGTPPSTAVEWDVYFVAENPTGPWAGQQDRLAVRIGDGWEFVTPAYGWLARLRSTGAAVWWNGEQWVDLQTGAPADGGPTVPTSVGQKVLYSRPGTPAPAERFLVPIDQALFLPANANGSVAICEATPETRAQYRLLRNGGQVGTVTFEAGSYTGDFVVPSSTAMGVGDVLALVAPNGEIPGLANVAISLRLMFLGGSS